MNPRSRLRLALTLLLFLMLSQPALRAHEIGVNRVAIEIAAEGVWTVTLRTAPRALLKRLSTGRQSSASTPAQLRTALIAVEPEIAASIVLDIDGVQHSLTARLTRLETPEDVTLPSFVVYDLKLRPPPTAHIFTWRFRLTSSTYPLTATLSNGARLTQWIEADAESAPVALNAAPDRRSVLPALRRYLRLGFLHVLPLGADHILFMIGLVLPRPGLRAALGQATAFTLAHSLTLSLALTGHVSAPPAIVEPLIALSIVYVALETIIPGRPLSRRLIAIFAFGLLHGLGFASALNEIRPADADIGAALIGFNLGIELAQAAVIATAMALLSLASRRQPERRRRIALALSCGVAAIGVFWTIERIQPAFAGWSW